ncbi:hypothetical protein BURPS305_1094 [Burkholderia pseudomallei 305]|nr:hypothetical protein BURPS305_1094 [Burkholderia pseudomallei 305]
MRDADEFGSHVRLESIAVMLGRARTSYFAPSAGKLGSNSTAPKRNSR